MQKRYKKSQKQWIVAVKFMPDEKPAPQYPMMPPQMMQPVGVQPAAPAGGAAGAPAATGAAAPANG